MLLYRYKKESAAAGHRSPQYTESVMTSPSNHLLKSSLNWRFSRLYTPLNLILFFRL
jgi:hypothetical protein